MGKASPAQKYLNVFLRGEAFRRQISANESPEGERLLFGKAGLHGTKKIIY